MSLLLDPRASDPGYWHVYEFLVEEHDGRPWNPYVGRAVAKDLEDLNRVLQERFSGVKHKVAYANLRLVDFVDAPKS